MRMLSSLALSIMVAGPCFSQSTTATSIDSAKPFTASSAPIPKHLVYRHFLAMVDEMDKRATSAGDPDKYAFARSFSRAGMENADLDTLLGEAKALTSELDNHDKKTQAVVKAYRAHAQNAVAQGQPLPPVPDSLHQLEAERTAIIMHHMAQVRAKMGKEKTRRLEAYFDYEVTPHVSLKDLVRPAADPKSVSSAAGFVKTQP